MRKICIDNKPCMGSNDLQQLLRFLFGYKQNPIDLTEGEIYNGHNCTCGKHFIVDKDDSGDTGVAYNIERFAYVPDISEITELLKEQEEYA